MMSRFSICLAASAAIALAALMPGPASAGAQHGCVEGGYGLGWKGGRPYYYTPFGVYGSYDDCYNPRTLRKRSDARYRSYNYR
jgi:hypothetical protein